MGEVFKSLECVVRVVEGVRGQPQHTTGQAAHTALPGRPILGPEPGSDVACCQQYT